MGLSISIIIRIECFGILIALFYIFELQTLTFEYIISDLFGFLNMDERT